MEPENTNPNQVQQNQQRESLVVPEQLPKVEQQPPFQPPLEVNNQKTTDKNKYIQLFINSWMKLNPAIRKILMIVGFIFGLLLLIAIFFSVSKRTGDIVKTSPTPSVILEQSPLPEIILNPSQYATDSAVLSVEEALKSIEKELGETVINDLKLAVPNLLWEINFED